jgi:hypothetical protein
MKAIAIGFDHQTPIEPSEVNEIAADLNIDFGRRQPIPRAQSKEYPLEIAAGAITVGPISDWEPEHIGLPCSATQLFRRDESSPAMPRHSPP